MLDLIRAWRERHWEAVDSATYGQIWQRYGGSVMTHPDIVAKLSALADLPVRYLAYRMGTDLQAAIAVWGRYQALSRSALKRYRRRDCFDLGNAETILPIAAECHARLRFRMRYVAAIHARSISNLRLQKEQLALCRAPEEYSKKFLYNQRRELRLFEEEGGRIGEVLNHSPADLARIYADLFARRWGFSVPAKTHLAEVLEIMRPYMFGALLWHGDRPVAIQLLYRVESPTWISVEYINGGVDPDFRSLSPGSVLTYLNTQAAWANARAAGKSLRYSFGRADRDYKSRWCHAVPVYHT